MSPQGMHRTAKRPAPPGLAPAALADPHPPGLCVPAQRYGFHGTSYSYLVGRAASMLGKSPDDVNLVLCHLGEETGRRHSGRSHRAARMPHPWGV